MIAMRGMNRTLKIALAVLALAALLVGAGWMAVQKLLPPPASAAEMDPTHRDLAISFLDALDAGEYARAEAMLAPKAREALSGGKLEEVWTMLPKQVGARESRSPPRGEQVGESRLVTITYKHALLALDARIHVDAEGLIDGFRIVPAAKAPEAPVQVDGERFTERAVDVAGLPGTLTAPRGDGPFPAVVLVHGSGAHDQDETIGPNKPFRDIAHGLAAKGVAVLRYAKRNLVRPQDFGPEATLDDEVVNDAVAAVALLRDEDRIDAGKVFVVGHSLGAMAAPRIGERAPDAAGLVLMAGNARPLHHVVPQQVRWLAALDGEVDEAERAAIAEVDAQREAIDAMLAGGAEPASPMLGIPVAYWRHLGGYDPVATAVALGKPMLVLQGGRDYQVTEVDDYAQWHDALSARSDVRLRLYPDLNHLFMPGEGAGNPQEYLVEGHVDERVIADIAEWIHGL